MKRTLLYLLCFSFSIPAMKVAAQDDESILAGKSIIKLNLSSAVLNHYAMQYEYVVNRNQSFALGVGVSPKVGLPFKKTLMDKFGDNDDARTAIESTLFTKVTITPEYRFYFGKGGAPTGFYLAPFARYTNMTLEQDYQFTPSSGRLHTANLKGKFTGIGGGVAMGAQWALSSKLTLDWWIVGPFVGKMKADFHAVDDMSDMSAQDKADLEGDIEGVDIPLWKIDATVGENTIDTKLNGPFYGVRAFGLSLGFRF